MQLCFLERALDTLLKARALTESTDSEIEGELKEVRALLDQKGFSFISFVSL